MRTTFVAILLWALTTIALCASGLWITARVLNRPLDHGTDPINSLMIMIGHDTNRAFEEGDIEGLTAYLRQLDAKLPGERFLVDSSGRDLIDGSDRATLARSAELAKFGIAEQPDGRLAVVIKPKDDRFRFIWVVEPWFEPPSAKPFIAVVVAIIAAMGAGLVLYISVPLRRLRRVMDRFGQGDLGARVGSRRRDEIGIVSREFDLLAERVETLVIAERRLLQDVSHELRSPLTRLDVAIDLAIKREDRGPLLKRIRRDITRLSVLVGELLHLTRTEGEPSTRVLEMVQPAELLRLLVEDCTIEAEAKGCHLELKELWPGSMKGDQELLRRAFENVVRNAIRHAPEGTPIEVALELCDQGVKVIVRDYGPGVPAEALSSLFDPFFRVEDDRSRESGGVGLGLAIARRAIAVHGGRIEARNAEPGLAIEAVLPGH